MDKNAYKDTLSHKWHAKTMPRKTLIIPDSNYAPCLPSGVQYILPGLLSVHAAIGKRWK